MNTEKQQIAIKQNIDKIQTLVQLICKNLRLKMHPLKQGQSSMYFDAQGEKRWAEEKIIGITVDANTQMVEIYDQLFEKINEASIIASDVMARTPLVSPAGEDKVFVQVNMAFYDPNI